MFKIHLLFDDVFLSLDVTSPHEVAPLVIDGAPDKVETVRKMLDQGYGAFGHLFDVEATTAIDLHYAVHSRLSMDFSPRIEEGAELVETYDPGIPDGAVT